METINLFIIDMSFADNVSGVDRYIGALLKGLEEYPFICVHWIHLCLDKTTLFHTEEQSAYFAKITIPLPQQYNEIINERFWIRRYNEQIYRISKHIFQNKQNCILHLHTLNLIDLAIYIRKQIHCRIITHLHCIPWKGYYNSNMCKFSALYSLYYLNNSVPLKNSDFITNNCELQSYTDADHIICVTKCAVDYLKRITDLPDCKISVIPNGINDLFYLDSISPYKDNDNSFKILYVGALSESKGIDYILKAIRKVVQCGYHISLTIAGKSINGMAESIEKRNQDLELNLLGKIPFDKLHEYYRYSDAGIIASLQEQSSYVAIEMAMFGLPIITTAVDGLDEMFTDNINSMKVNTVFSKQKGLYVDVDMMSDKIITLIEHKDLRNELSMNVRELYKQKYSLQRMVQQTISIYQYIIRRN